MRVCKERETFSNAHLLLFPEIRLKIGQNQNPKRSQKMLKNFCPFFFDSSLSSSDLVSVNLISHPHSKKFLEFNSFQVTVQL